MYCSRLQLQHFRNFPALDWKCHPLRNCVQGRNGQGKTNLMEALHVLLTLRPLRSGQDFRPLLKHDQKVFSCSADMVFGADKKESFHVAWTEGKKMVQRGGQEVLNRQFLEHPPVLFFSPDNASLLVESPQMRRSLIDRLVFSMDSQYYELLQKYQYLLKQRNATLKLHRDDGLLQVLDRQLVPLAMDISTRRSSLIEQMQDIFSRQWEELKPDTFPMEVRYSVQLPETWEERLEQYRERSSMDWQQQTTTLGPHREDILFKAGGRAPRSVLSHGERKSAAFAFNLAFATLYQKEWGTAPLLLVDDLAAELDTATLERSLHRLVHWPGQIILTALDQQAALFTDHPLFATAPGTLWRVEEGALFPL